MTKSQFMFNEKVYNKILDILNDNHPKNGYDKFELINKLYGKMDIIKNYIDNIKGDNKSSLPGQFTLLRSLLSDDIIEERVNDYDDPIISFSYYTANFDDYQKKLNRKKIISKLLSS